jgi:pentatricopeptide repeat protein
MKVFKIKMLCDFGDMKKGKEYYADMQTAGLLSMEGIAEIVKRMEVDAE